MNVRLEPARQRDDERAEGWRRCRAGGTNCSAPLRTLNQRRAKGDLVVYVSDNESWIDSPCHGRFGGGRTETMNEWSKFKARNPQARMVCIDIQPYGTTQAREQRDIVNVGGFSDQVFRLLADVAAGGIAPDHWVREIEARAIVSDVMAWGGWDVELPALPRRERTSGTTNGRMLSGLHLPM